MEYAFIDGSKNDRATRRQARSHAMRGKNAGRKLHRRSRLHQSHHSKIKDSASVKFDTRQDMTTPVSILFKPFGSLTFGPELFNVAFPVSGIPQSQDTISQCKHLMSREEFISLLSVFNVVAQALYLPQLCRGTDQTKSYWMQMLFVDEICEIYTLDDAFDLHA
jgi:hypothetical protein